MHIQNERIQIVKLIKNTKKDNKWLDKCKKWRNNMKTNDNHYNLLNIEINSKIELSKENITSYKQMMNIISKNDTVSQYIKI